MSSAEQLEQSARQLIGERKYREAAEACEQLNEAFPDYSSGWYTSSHLAMLIKEPRLAVSTIDRALQLSPGKPEWLFKRVEYLTALGDKEAALETAGQLAGHRFDGAEVSTAFARALGHLGLFDDAVRHFARAAELEPNNGLHYFSLAAAERSRGDRQAAHDAASRCIELRPDDAEAYLLRSGLVTHTAEANNVDSLLAAIARAADNIPNQVKLRYALAKEYEDIGEYDAAFEHLSKGASLRRSTMQYTPEEDLDAMTTIRNEYTAEKFTGEIEGFINAEPIFIVGMPRTGTVLVDRILGNHSVVQSAGELQAFSVELVRHCRQVPYAKVDTTRDMVDASTKIDFAALGEDYIAATRRNTGRTAHFVDKFPQNFLYAGLIHLALPKAKIVVLERDPMDSCLAIYKNLFDAAYPFSYDLAEIGNYYVAWRQMIEHWQTVMPGVIHVVNYEDLIARPRTTVEDLLDYCGLSWEDACLKFDEDGKTVKLDYFRSAIGKWQHYEKHLQPLADILGELD